MTRNKKLTVTITDDLINILEDLAARNGNTVAEENQKICSRP